MTSSGTSSSAASRMRSITRSPTSVALGVGDLDDHLVVHLEHELALVAAGLERLVDAHQRDLEDVGGETLDAGVHRLPLPCLADPPVGVEQLGDRSAPPEQRLGVAVLAGLQHRGVHVRLHVREGHEVGVEDDRRLVGGDAESLAEPVGLHPVGEAVRHHLRLRTLLERDVSRLDAEHPRSGGVVDVLPAGERLDQTGVGGEVGDAAQLDLVVVGDQQLACRATARTPCGTRGPRRCEPGCCGGWAGRS